MTDQGYIVFWNEPDEIHGGESIQRRRFATKQGAEEFHAKLPLAFRGRVFEKAHTSDVEWDTQMRDSTDALARRRMVELMLKHNITLPAKQFDKWRPTEEKTGRIDGVSDGLTCIMTDGLLGYFTREGREPLYGHIEWFKWDVPDISFVPYIDPQSGERRFFKSVKDAGAPKPFFKRPRRESAGTPKARKQTRKPEKMTAQAALQLLAKLASQVNGSQSVNSAK